MEGCKCCCKGSIYYGFEPRFGILGIVNKVKNVFAIMAYENGVRKSSGILILSQLKPLLTMERKR